MSTTKQIVRNTAQVAGVHLTPVVCADEQQVAEAAFDGIRRRPVMARNEEGELVVCCSRTAKEHGWKVEGRLFDRNTNRKAPAPVAPAAPVAKKAPAKKAARLATLEEMLGETFGPGAVTVSTAK